MFSRDKKAYIENEKKAKENKNSALDEDIWSKLTKLTLLISSDLTYILLCFDYQLAVGTME